MSSNELLLKPHDQADTPAQHLADWQAIAEKIQARAPGLTLAGQVLAQANDLPGMDAQAQARRATLPAGTIQNADEMEDRLDQARSEIETALGQGPVIL